MATPLEDLAHAYLEGDLSPEEARAFEQGLAERPELSMALARVVALRDLLQALPPDAPPPGLEERIAASLRVQVSEPKPKQPSAALAQLQAVLAGAGWGLRGPALAFEPAAAAASRLVASRGEERSRPPAKPLWRRARELEPVAAAATKTAVAATRSLGRLVAPAPKPPAPLWRRAVASVWRRAKK